MQRSPRTIRLRLAGASGGSWHASPTNWSVGLGWRGIGETESAAADDCEARASDWVARAVLLIIGSPLPSPTPPPPPPRGEDASAAPHEPSGARTNTQR